MPDLIAADRTARSQALDPHDSFIVDAPAGAGKTELLTQRFLVLLARVAEPEEVVALTFTRKAAAEMRDRVMSSLRNATHGLDKQAPEHTRTTHTLAEAVLRQDKDCGWQLLQQPGRLRIMTLDALSMNLARQMPLLTRFGNQPALSTECQPLYEQAARETLGLLHNDESHTDGDTIARVLDYFDNDSARLQKMLVAMLERRDQWQRQAFNAQHHTLQQEVRQVLDGLIRNELSDIADHFVRVFSPDVMAAARHAASHSPESEIHLLQDWDSPLPTDSAALPHWRALATLFLTGDGELRKDYRTPINLAGPANKAQKDILKTTLAELGNNNLAPVLQRIRTLPDPDLGHSAAAIVSELSRLLQLATAHLWLTFIREKTVDHTEIAQRALTALGEPEAPTDLAQQLDYQIRHLLVDEFQDTSPSQVMLLEKLTAGWSDHGGQTLFLVGDPMQSIYRFRKADVGLFIRVREDGIGHIRPRPLRLYKNYRSTANIVNWVNQTFEGVFAERDDAMRGAVRFSPAVAHQAPAPGIGVSIHPIICGERDPVADTDTAQTPANEREAEKILQLIRQTQTDKPDATIAVLVRARSHLNALISLLQSTSPRIPFQAVEIDPLAGRQPIQDLVSLTRALHHQGDRIHWLSILRAPWCGLRLEDLHHLAADNHEQTIWSLMRDNARVATLSRDGQQRLGRVRHVIEAAYDRRSQLRPRRWIEGTWRALNGHMTLDQLSDVADVQAYFKLLDQLDQSGTLDLDGIEAGIHQLFAAPDTSIDSTRVQLMTIHKSKGLQFDTVIIPGLHKRLPSDDKPLLIWDNVLLDDDQEHLVVAPIAPMGTSTSGTPTAYDLLRNLEMTRSQNEAQRVLYVGVTRAERQLHLIGAAQRDNKSACCTALRAPASTSLLSPLWPMLEPDFLAAASVVSTDAISMSPTIKMDSAEFVPKLARLKDTYVTPLITEALSPKDGPTIAKPSTVENTIDMVIGTLTHRYLEAIANDGPEAWPTSRILGLRSTMARMISQQGHKATVAAEAATHVISALNTALSSDHGRWILSPHTAAACEIPMSSLVPETPAAFAHHVIDRMFIDDGVRWIIDYKTMNASTVLSEEQLRNKAYDYQSQLTRYASLFATDSMRTKTAIFFPAHGTLVEVPIDSDALENPEIGQED